MSDNEIINPKEFEMTIELEDEKKLSDAPQTQSPAVNDKPQTTVPEEKRESKSQNSKIGSMLEDNFSRSMQLYDGVGFIFERPMTLGLIILAMVLIVLPGLRSRFSKKIGGDVAEGD